MAFNIDETLYSPYTTDLLANHQYQGQTNDCGPYCLAITTTTLNSIGAKGAEVADDLNRVRWNSILPTLRRIPGNATLPWGMQDGFRQRGLIATWRIFTPMQVLQDRLPLDNVLVVINGGWKPMWAHYRVLCAWSKSFGWGFVDPAVAEPSVHWVSDAEFRREWRAMGQILITVKRPNPDLM